tara:strand:- start:635 stop:778 length:144 start_codon:yes stop_codon:yes gene_type:complete
MKAWNSICGWIGWLFVELALLPWLPEAIQSLFYSIGCKFYGLQREDK